MKSIGVHQCLIPLSKGEGYQPNFPLDFSLPKIKRMFTVEVDHYALKELKVDYYKIISKGLKIIKVGSDGQIDGYPTLKVNLYTIDSFLFHTHSVKIGEAFSMKFYDEKIWKDKEPFYYEDWNGKTTLRGLFSSKPLSQLHQEILESCEKGKTINL
jgi:hypothetical protein|tara:strand:+ start:87 stop:554 length:468 start_codon:yes stop_codon:yes gene_type:complete